MITLFFALLFIVSIYCFFKYRKIPNNKNLLGISLMVIVISILGLVVSTQFKEDKQPFFLDVPTHVITNKDNDAIIEGTTHPGTKLRIGLGIIGDTDVADKDGRFKLTYNLGSRESHILEVTAESDTEKITKSVKVMQNENYAKTDIKENDETNDTIEQNDNDIETESKNEEVDENTEEDDSTSNHVKAYNVSFPTYNLYYVFDEKTKQIIYANCDGSRDEPSLCDITVHKYKGNLKDGIEFDGLFITYRRGVEQFIQITDDAGLDIVGYKENTHELLSLLKKFS